MRIIIALVMVVFLSSLGYGQSSVSLPKEEAIAKARRWAESYNPPMNSSRMQEEAVYVPEENAWVVHFADESADSGNPGYVVKVDATSGKDPEVLRGSQIQRYESYFEGAANTSTDAATSEPTTSASYDQK